MFIEYKDTWDKDTVYLPSQGRVSIQLDQEQQVIYIQQHLPYDIHENVAWYAPLQQYRPSY